MMVPLVFHPDYAPPSLPHFARLQAVAQLAQNQQLGVFHQPSPLQPDALMGLHDADYVDAFYAGRRPLANSAHLPWSPALVQAVSLMLGGQLLGAALAKQHGVAINLACGFHHAHPARGGGFCVFNGLALVAHAFPQWQVAVLDCDEHGGDGTEAFVDRLPNLTAISIFGSRFGLRGADRSRALRVPAPGTDDVDDRYLEVIDQALGELLDAAPDLVIYQAGMDSHCDDPRATLKVSTEALARRDARVFSSLRKANLPVLGVLAGAYQSPDITAGLYRSTLLAARRAAEQSEAV
jgi:acetoin utilization deacetylase AcuC-like enzyme